LYVIWLVSWLLEPAAIAESAAFGVLEDDIVCNFVVFVVWCLFGYVSAYTASS